MMIEDVHFRRETHPADAVGWKALARGLSDIAAMGGEPRFCLLSLALAPWADQRWIDGFYRGFLRLARRTGTTLAGGDLARAERVACDVVVCGAVPRGKRCGVMARRQATESTFPAGWAARPWGSPPAAARPGSKHCRPEPRLEFGRLLRGRATAAIDLSDGLSLDLHRLCLASGVAAALDEAIPFFPGATLEQALHGGEDYELLFTAPAGVEGAVRIGAIRKGRHGRVYFQGKPLAPLGYDHFR